MIESSLADGLSQIYCIVITDLSKLSSLLQFFNNDKRGNCLHIYLNCYGIFELRNKNGRERSVGCRESACIGMERRP
jgi:hypothetical protein